MEKQIKKHIGYPIIVGRMAYERYRLIETKDGIIRQGMGLSGKIEAILVHVTGGICVKFLSNSEYCTVPIEWVTTDENMSKVDIDIFESNRIMTKQTQHVLCNSKIRVNKRFFQEKLDFLEKQKQQYANRN